MENVPKIVRERLRAASVAVDHPDADVLTAFAERSLREAERSAVLQHLAHCGECREVIALALPAKEAAEASVTPARKRWLGWPALRWGFAVAGVVALASLGIVNLGRRNSATFADRVAQPAPTEARNESLPVAAPQVSAEREKTLVLSASGAGKATDEERAPVRSKPAAPAVNVPTAATGGFTHAPLSHGPRQTYQANQFQQQNSNALAGASVAVPAPAPPPMAKQQASNQLAANVRIPSSADAVEVQTPSVLTNTESQNPDLQNGTVADQPPNYGHGEEKIGRAKEPTDTTVVQIEREKIIAASARPASRSSADSLPNARWAITSAGGLQRSLDQGNSWQDVNVKASPATSTFDAVASLSLEKAKDAAKADKKQNAPAIFRAVAANGSEVWAGGAAGQLYHSIDAGNHWSKVVPSADGAVLSGDVVALEFVDAQHGKVSTSTSEVWVTGDDGLTWQKQ